MIQNVMENSPIVLNLNRPAFTAPVWNLPVVWSVTAYRERKNVSRTNTEIAQRNEKRLTTALIQSQVTGDYIGGRLTSELGKICHWPAHNQRFVNLYMRCLTKSRLWDKVKWPFIKHFRRSTHLWRRQILSLEQSKSKIFDAGRCPRNRLQWQRWLCQVRGAGSCWGDW